MPWIVYENCTQNIFIICCTIIILMKYIYAHHFTPKNYFDPVEYYSENTHTHAHIAISYWQMVIVSN